jgi:hypothetical protein
MGLTIESVIIAGLVPGIQPSVGAGASCKMDPGDKHRDDNGVRLSGPLRKGCATGCGLR